LRQINEQRVEAFSTFSFWKHNKINDYIGLEFKLFLTWIKGFFFSFFMFFFIIEFNQSQFNILAYIKYYLILKEDCSCKSREHVWVCQHYSNDTYDVVWWAKPNIHGGVLIFMVAHPFLCGSCNQKNLSFPLATFSFLFFSFLLFFPLFSSISALPLYIFKAALSFFSFKLGPYSLYSYLFFF